MIDDRATSIDFLGLVGPIASALRRRWISTGAIFLSTVLAIFIPRYWVDDEGAPLSGTTPWIVSFGVVGALSLVVERVAAAYEDRQADLALRGSEDTAANAGSDLNTFLVEAIEVSFLEGVARDKAMITLSRILTMCAAKSIGPGSRASYYSLFTDSDGSRTLGAPVHTTEYGRSDKPKRPFVESEDPGHPIWRLMDSSDEEPEVVTFPQEVYGLDWNRKRYRTYLSVPVKANDVQFGFLSVNNATAGAIGEAQRAIILAMARTMAVVLGLAHGPRNMAARLTTSDMSVVNVKVDHDRERER